MPAATADSFAFRVEFFNSYSPSAPSLMRYVYKIFDIVSLARSHVLKGNNLQDLREYP
jgi:hypothetical protein